MATISELESDINGYKRNAEYWKSKGDPQTAKTWEAKQKSAERMLKIKKSEASKGASNPKPPSGTGAGAGAGAGGSSSGGAAGGTTYNPPPLDLGSGPSAQGAGRRALQSGRAPEPRTSTPTDPRVSAALSNYDASKTKGGSQGATPPPEPTATGLSPPLAPPLQAALDQMVLLVRNPRPPPNPQQILGIVFKTKLAQIMRHCEGN